MESKEQWLQLHPLVKPCWIVKGFFASLILPLIFSAPMIISFILDGYIIILFYFIIILFIINIIIISWAFLFYERYAYRIGEKTINIKRGILWKKDVTIPYERIQHVSTTRGPIEQLFKLHIMNIFTAGTASMGAGFGGSSGIFAAEGYLPGIKDPEGLKKTIMNRVKESKSGSGLEGKTEKEKIKRKSSESMDSEILEELKMIRKILQKNQK